MKEITKIYYACSCCGEEFDTRARCVEHETNTPLDTFNDSVSVGDYVKVLFGGGKGETCVVTSKQWAYNEYTRVHEIYLTADFLKGQPSYPCTRILRSRGFSIVQRVAV